MGVLNFNLENLTKQLQEKIDKINPYAVIFVEEYFSENIKGEYEKVKVLLVMINGNKYRLYHSLLDTQDFYDEEDFIAYCMDSFDEEIEEITNVRNYMSDKIKLYIVEFDEWSFVSAHYSLERARWKCNQSTAYTIREVDMEGKIINDKIYALVDKYGVVVKFSSNKEKAENLFNKIKDVIKLRIVEVEIL